MKNLIVKYFSQKLSNRFTLWFSITLVFPLLGLFFFTINSFNDREELLKRQVRESQLDRALKIENLFINNFRAGYQQAVRGVFKKINNENNLVDAYMNPLNKDSASEFIKDYENFYYGEMLPYLGVHIDSSLNLDKDREEIERLQAESFLPVHFLKLFYSNPDWHDFYDGIALSAVQSCSEKTDHTLDTQDKCKRIRSLHKRFKDIHSDRKKWVPNRRFPEYKDIQSKDVLSGDSKIDSKKIFDVFRQFKILQDLSETTVLTGQKLNILRELIRDLVRNRYSLLELITELRNNYYALKREIKNLSVPTTKILSVNRFGDISLESFLDLKNCVNRVVAKLESSKDLDSSLRKDLAKYNELKQLIDASEKSIDQCKDSILKYFHIEGKMLTDTSWKHFFEAVSHQDSKSFLSDISSEQLTDYEQDVSALLPIYYLLKLLEQGLKGKEWIYFAQSTEIYAFPFREIYELKDDIGEVEIKPNQKEGSKNFMSGYFGLGKITNVKDSIEDSWQVVIKLIPDNIIPFNATWDLSMRNSKSNLASVIWNSNLAETRNKFSTIKIGAGDLSMIWDVVPMRYDLNNFVMGHSPMPKGYLLGLMGDHGLRLQFFRLWNSPIFVQTKDQLKSTLNQELLQAYLQVVPESQRALKPGLNYRDAGPEVKGLIESVFSFKYALDDSRDSTADFWGFVGDYLGFDKNYLLRRSKAWLLATDLQVLALRDSLNQDQVPADLYVDEVIKSHVGGQSKTYLDFMTWLKNPVSPFFYDFQDANGHHRIGSVFPGGELNNFVFMLSMDAKTAYRENGYLFLLLVLICSLAILFGVGLGRLLAQVVVTPVNQLSRNVADFSDGKLKQKVEVTRHDEIGRMAFYFNEMVGSIETKISEMESINRLNDALLRGESLKDLIQYAVSEFCTATGAQLGYLGFFEHASREKLMGSGSFGIVPENLEDLELRFKVLANKLSDQEFHFMPYRRARNYYCNNLFALRIRPQSEPLQDLEGVLEEMSNLGTTEANLQIEGFLMLGNFPDGALDSEKLDFLHSFSSQTGTVILKAYLDKAKKDNEEGQNIQEGLMPSEAPDSRGLLDISFSFVAAKYLGGDFFDFVKFENSDHIGMLISDVSGKGIGPSLFGTTCQAYLQLLALDPKRTGETLEDINERLCENKSNSLFATAFYLSIDLTTLKMTYSSAGHNKMYLFRQATGKIEYLSAKGLVLGMFSPGVYQTSNLDLEVGDWIILYTDGITELENPSLELYGMERFEELILANTHRSADELRDLILADLDVYRDSVPPSDDITFILVKILQEPDNMKTSLRKNDIRYMASQNSKMFHIAGSAEANRIKIDSRVYFDSWKEAVESGRKPSKRLADKVNSS